MIWSGLARNLKLRTPGRRVVLMYARPWRAILSRKKIADHVVYRNNPDVFLVVPKPVWRLLRPLFPSRVILEVDMDAEAPHYWQGDTPERIGYKSGGHAIQIACDAYGIRPAVLQPRLVLGRREEARVRLLLHDKGLAPGRYICVEPHANDEFTPNKAWPWEHWQHVADELRRRLQPDRGDVQIAQIGRAGGRLLDGVVDLTGRTTFREAGGLIRDSACLITYEGGLAHLAAAAGRQSVVLLSGIMPAELMAYPQHVNLLHPVECSGCGLKAPCPRGRPCMARITPESVVAAAMELLAAGPAANT